MLQVRGTPSLLKKYKTQNMIKSKRIMLSAALMTLLLSASAQKRAFAIEDLYRVKGVASVSLSPDGKTICYTSSSSDLKNQKSYSDIFLMNVDGSHVKALTEDGKSGSAVWNKDGKSIYYTNYSRGSAQIFRMDLTTCKSEQLTDYGLGIDNPVISPDGRYVAFTAEVYPDLGADADANKARMEKKERGAIQAHLADRLLYRHWTSYNDGRHKHLILFDTQTKTYRDLTPGNYSLIFMLGGGIAYNFSPDSQEICFVSNHDEHQEASTNADLWTVPVDGGEPTCVTPENKAWDGTPTYSPDGRYIAYRQQQVPGYESDRFRLAIYDREAKKSIVLTEKFDNWVDDYKWSPDSKNIYFLGEVQGGHPLYKLDIAKQTISPVITGKAIAEFDFDSKGMVYYTYSTTGKPTALYRQQVKKWSGVPMASGKEQQITFLNQQLEDEVDIRPSESIWVDGAGGDKVQVFIVKPHDFDPAKKYPLIINVHGGPQMQWMNSFRGDWQVYPAAGYVVAYPNPHGSTGYGQAFTRAISGDWGGKVFEDVMKVTDKLATLEYVDSTRMGAMGWSYGGYMMNWLQGHTKRFKCLASMMGVYDLRSMWGSTEEVWFPNFELEGQPYNSGLYEKWSPSSYIKNFSTPTLVMTGELDYRVPYTQSLQYFTALQTLNIPSRLIVLKYDGHWPSNLKSMPLYYNAHLDWFHRYLGGAPAPWDTEKMVNNEVEYK